MEAGRFIVSTAALGDGADVLAALSNLIRTELETGSADAAVNLLGLGRIDCATTLTHVLQTVLERVHLDLRGLLVGSTVPAEDV